MLFELERTCAKEEEDFTERDLARAEELAALTATLQKLRNKKGKSIIRQPYCSIPRFGKD